MFKKILLSLLIAGTFGIAYSYADFAEGNLAVINCSVDFTDAAKTAISHTDIDQVFVPKGILNAKVNVKFGSDCAYADCKLEYAFEENPSETKIKTVTKSDISPDVDFYIKTESLKDESDVWYRLVLNPKNSRGEAVTPVYYPADESFIKIPIKDNFAGDISDAGSITIHTGDQEAGDIILSFNNAFTGTKKITLKFEEMISGISSVSGLGRQEEYTACIFSVETDPAESLTFAPGTAKISNAPILKSGSAKNFVLQKEDTTGWTDENIAVTVDSVKNTFSCDIPSTGKFRIYATRVLGKSDYRPKKRVVVKGRTKFLFEGLQQGDSVKIFNMNGKKIREISSGGGSVEWDGKTDSGKWAKSGIYLYQIKVDGDTISGTIAFVK